MKNFFYFFVLVIVINNIIIAQSVIVTIDVEAGWNLIGSLATGEIQSIISTEPPGIITASIYGYNPGGGYSQANSLERGKGYWLKVSQNGKIIFLITPVQLPSDTIYVSAGWNLMGSLATGENQSIISTEPPGIITASIYGYIPGGGYYQANSLERGKGYWVKVNQNGIIIINIDLTPQPPTSGIHIPSANGITWNWNSLAGATGYKWNITDSYSSAIDVGIATSKSETGLSCYTGYTRYIWAYNNYGNSASTELAQTTLDDPPEAPTAAAHDTSTVYIIWKWNSVFEATGYKWNTTNDFNTASDVGGDTSKLELGLNCNNQYTRYVWAYNACGNSLATTLIQITSQCLTDSCGLPITDTRDAKIYNTVQISNQCWMAENLNIGTMISGANEMTNNGIIEKYCYNNNSNNCNTYGGLYQWNEAMAYTLSSDSIPSGRKGICPIGWHLPSDGEWTMLTDYLGGLNVAGGKMKEVGTAHWLSPNTGATNSSGFTALGAGVRYYNGTFIIFNYGTDFWTTTQKDFVYPFKVWDRRLFHNSAIVERGYDFKTEGWSVRCIKDFISAPTAGTHVPSETSIIWNWNPVNGATGYKWNSINDYSSATDMGTSTSKTEGGLKEDSLYTRYVWAYNDNLHSLASTLAQTTTTTQWVCGQEFLDQRDGQTYNTVLINGKCWMAENMNIGTIVNGTTAQTNNGSAEKYCYEDNPSNCDIYGGLYQGDEAVQYNPIPGTQGVCPQGWHIPEDWEWTELTSFLGGLEVAGGKMKEEGTTHWAPPNFGATNSSGFTGLPGGQRTPAGGFEDLTYQGNFWSSTHSAEYFYWTRYLYFSQDYAYRVGEWRETGNSVRCIKN